jgi:uncharacterized membrane protein YsdA (DUF1294 family)
MADWSALPIWFIVWLALMVMNIAAFAAFGIDKKRARRGDSRITERDLLLLAALGGTGGAYLGRWYFRHKTRKQSFSVALHLTTLAQAILLIWFVTRP